MYWLGLLLVIYAAWCTGLYVLQDRMMFPLDMLEPAMAEPPAGAEPIVIEPDEGRERVRVESYLLRGSQTLNPAPLVVFFHGNAETTDNCFLEAGHWLRRGYAVLLIEYRGYGRSDGTPSEKHLVLDSLNFIDQVVERKTIDGSRIVLHGRSLGAGVAAQVAERLATQQRPNAIVRAVIVQSTFTSVPRLAARMLAPPFLIRNTFRSDRALARANVPLLILHGVDDEIIPVSHARRLHAQVANSTLVELPGHHNDFPLDEDRYWTAIDFFLAPLHIIRR